MIPYFWGWVKSVWFRDGARLVAGEAHTPGDVRCVSGGIGIVERAAMEAMATEYKVTPEFSTVTGANISGVEVIIRDAGGSELLSAVSDFFWICRRAVMLLWLHFGRIRGLGS